MIGDPTERQMLETLELESWMDVLQNCSHSEIRTAWATYQQIGPRAQNGSLRKPDAGAIYKIILKARPSPRPVENETEARPRRATQEEAAMILSEAGVRVNEHGGVVSLGGKRA